MDDTKLPKISVCVAAYNAEAYIARTLDSLLAQNYPNYEIIVSDNRSNDSTPEIVKRYAASTGRIKYVLMPVHGECEDNLNNCAKLGDGEFVAVYHADDIYYGNALMRSAMALIQDTGAGAVVMSGERISSDDTRIRDGSFSYTNTREDYDFQAGLDETLRIGSSPFICSSAMYRRSVLSRYGIAWNRRSYVTASDLGLFLELLKHCHVKLLRERLMGYRITQSQGSNAVIRRRTAKADFFRVMRKYRREISSSPFRNNYCFSVLKDLLVRALNYAYDGETSRSSRRLKAFFMVFAGKLQFIWRFSNAYAAFFLGACLAILNILPFQVLRRRFVLMAFNLGRED